MKAESKKSLEDRMLLEKLREILLERDREELQEVKRLLNDPVEVSKRVSPIFDEKLRYLKDNFPREFGTMVDETIDKRLKSSQEELLNIIYPVLGQMIRKFVSQQFQMLKDSIDYQVKNTFSSRGILGRFRAKLFGVKDSDLMLGELDAPIVQEVYVIQRYSGLLMGSYSKTETIDQDLIAGMLTAIKSFVEDAFQKEREELEMIQYGSFKIIIQNYYKYYIAVAISGSLKERDRDELSEKILTFAQNKLKKDIEFITGEVVESISTELKAFFEEDGTNLSN